MEESVGRILDKTRIFFVQVRKHPIWDLTMISPGALSTSAPISLFLCFHLEKHN